MSEFTKGQELWHDVHGLVTVVYASGGYVYVRDEQLNSYTIPESELFLPDDDDIPGDFGTHQYHDIG